MSLGTSHEVCRDGAAPPPPCPGAVQTKKTYMSIWSHTTTPQRYVPDSQLKETIPAPARCQTRWFDAALYARLLRIVKFGLLPHGFCHFGARPPHAAHAPILPMAGEPTRFGVTAANQSTPNSPCTCLTWSDDLVVQPGGFGAHAFLPPVQAPTTTIRPPLCERECDEPARPDCRSAHAAVLRFPRARIGSEGQRSAADASLYAIQVGHPPYQALGEPQRHRPWFRLREREPEPVREPCGSKC